MDEPREIREDAKLKNLPAEKLLELWEFRNPEPGGKKLKFAAIRAEIPLRYGVTVSGSTLSEFYAWLRVWKRWRDAKDFALQARTELAKDPLVSDEELDRFADRVMKTEVAVNKDVKGYVAIRKLGLAEKVVAFNQDKLTAASKSKVEAGLDALLAEIQGNPKALAAFQVIQQEVAKG